MNGTVVLVLEGSITRADVPDLCSRLLHGLAADAGGQRVVVCDVGGLGRPDAGTLDALARLQLTARRNGSQVVLRAASDDLRLLLELAGLRDVVPVCPESPAGDDGGSDVEVVWQPEQCEQPRVEEVRDADDPAV